VRQEECCGVRRFVLPVGIGDAGVVEDVTSVELEAAVGYMLARAQKAESKSAGKLVAEYAVTI